MSSFASARTRGRVRRPERPRWRLGRRGVTAAEFALIAPLLVLVIIAGIDASRYFLTLHALRTAVAQAARAAIVDPTLSGNGQAVVDAAGGLDLLGAGATLRIDRTTPTPGMAEVTVTASTTYRFFLSVFGLGSVPLSETQTFRYAL